MSSNVMANFAALDELVQVIYQGMDKFVLLSDVASDRWNVHLGLTGPDARWWQGSWAESEVLGILGSKAGDQLLTSFADKLAESIVQGELHIETDARYKLTLGPTSKKPMHVNLEEMSSAEALEYATEVFATIALQAQSRQSRLIASAVSPPKSKPTTAKERPSVDVHKADVAPRERKVPEKPQNKRQASQDVPAKPAVSGSRPAVKGASLANPNKKARKYQSIEFASDEE